MKPKLFQVLINDGEIPSEVFDRCDKVKSLYPEFDHVIYDNSMCREFLSSNFDKKVLNAYDSLLPYSYKSDLMRFALLYTYGGMYSDIGLRHYGKIDTNHELVICEDIKEADDGPDDKQSTSLIFAGRPKLRVFAYAIEKICFNVKHKSYNHYLSVTGPRLWTEAVKLHTADVEVKRYPMTVGDTWWGWGDNGNVIVKSKENARVKGLAELGLKQQCYIEMFNNRNVYSDEN